MDRTPPPSPERQADASVLRIVAIYVLVSSIWVYVSDRYIATSVVHLEEFRQASTLKNWGFVVASGALLFVLLRLAADRIIAAMARERQVTQAREQTLTLLQAVLTSSSDAIYAKDLEGRYLVFNAASGGVVGIEPAAAYGRTDVDLLGPTTGAEVMAIDAAVIQAGHPITSMETLELPRGRSVFHSTRGPLRDASGSIIGMFGVSRDITQLKQSEEMLRRANRSLKGQAASHAALQKSATRTELAHEVCAALVNTGGYTGRGWAADP